MTYKACCAGGVIHPHPVGAVVGVEVLAAVLVEAASPAHLGRRTEGFRRRLQVEESRRDETRGYNWELRDSKRKRYLYEWWPGRLMGAVKNKRTVRLDRAAAAVETSLMVRG